MRLTNILREIDGDEDGKQQMKVNYDLAIYPTNIKAALDALNNTKNYGIYAQNMRDPKAIIKAFGPSIPAQKAGAAWKDWDTRSDDEKAFKITDIKNRHPEVWETVSKETEPGYDNWKSEGGRGTLEEYLYTISGKSLPKDIIGRYGVNYFPMKTPDNLKKYGGKLEQDVHYIVKDEKIIFPFTLENSYKTKPYLSKVLKTIMDNANIEFKLVDIEQSGEDTPKVIEKPEAVVIPPLTVTTDTLDQLDKVIKMFQKEIGDVPTSKYAKEAIELNGERKYKLTVTGISKDQRQKLLITKTTIRENNEFDMRNMLVRAGIIK